ncbi:AbrB/MazE/SpoVT family DNA-binding domain-containing protein [Oryzibacter oryziterrae]|uniref:AbrB/MazE/SpoVT family DNA-binding domain-containing protein n=1 Tax=Oryzibacter oryziterrae TaxID=2766474 RepID=UPI001F3FB184|nr:AbrB/MazE/SpoVT family DNA-binding domain-containing protein [Oryzibacter oryziterrae]
MATLSITSRGQVTLRRDILRHLDLQPGDKLQVELLPDGRAELRAARPSGSFSALRGVLKGKSEDRGLTIDEINEAIADAGAEAGGFKR